MTESDQSTSRYVGFDVPQIRGLVTGLRAAATSAPTLHQDVAAVLADADEDTDGPVTTSPGLENVMVSVFGIPLHAPGALAGPLDEIADSSGRRCDHLEELKDLEQDGITVDPSLAFLDESLPDRADADEAVEAIEGLDGKDFGTNGNRDDLRDIASTLKGLSSAELNWVLNDLSVEDRQRLSELVGNTDDSGLNPFDHNGLPHHERLDLGGALLSKATPGQWSMLTQMFPGVHPPFDPGDDNKKGATIDGVTWDVPKPPVPLFDDGVSADDISQGGVGDCWFLASVVGVAGRDPQAIREGIKQNPNGTVSVRLHDSDGAAHWVTVSPELPLDENGNPAGAGGTDELWVAYYEKAFATFYDQDNDGHTGSYRAIEGDFTDKAGPYLTGRPSEDLDVDFDEVRESYEDGKVIVAGTPGEKKVEDKFKDGYVTGHAYVVDGFTDDGKIILRNPWGTAYPKLEMTPEEFEKYFSSAGSFPTRD
ncbi:calpain family cysteine protease [Haloactinopolyspora alba]|uniref:Calpain family cysteine protease n=1 Tax=Haloactinopolyspora alba TaxID=648780 RepID=A0A2P8DJ78_9ACTN|nr:C2 family cysteine protease [Haloactinopolyspora alba]PSK97251.1 calpain family cysteine protease [Haloactinopolyspora alba]